MAHARVSLRRDCIVFSLVVACVLLLVTTPRLRSASFIRGDVDENGAHEITDPIGTLGYLFLGSPESLPCLDAADADDNGMVELTDAVYLLEYLFLGGLEPPAPVAFCGDDETPDDLGCAEYSACAVAFELLKGGVERDESPSVDDAELEALVGGNTHFALDLYGQIRGREGNVFFSPYSISVALAMTYAGARSATREQMASALHFTLPQERLHPAFNALDLLLESRAEGPPEGDGDPFMLAITNSIWGQKGYGFLDTFLDVLSESYGAGLRILDFEKEPESCRHTINLWVSEQTQRKIPDLLTPGSILTTTRLVLANAVYFKASWLHPFEPSATRDAPFYLLDGSETTVPMMRTTDGFGFAEGDGYEAIEVGYVGEAMSMVILLPSAGRFEDFEASLDAGQLGTILGRLERGWVRLDLPRFAVECRLSLKSTLIALGMTDAFTPYVADFSGIDGTLLLYIEKVIHKAIVTVDEAGTEAAAATAVIIPPIGIPEEVTVNRPFLFLIRDVETGAILFLGRVLNPGEQAGA